MSSRHRREDLAEVGDEPDPRFRFANERTFLAWNRTALALVGAGLAAVQFLDGALVLRSIIGLVPIVLGAWLSWWSYGHWYGNEARLRAALPLGYSPQLRLLAVGFTVIALAAGVYVVVSVAGA